MSVITLTGPQHFHETVSLAEVPVVMDFFADWCGPCKAMTPILDEISGTEDFYVAKIDVDDYPGLARDHGVQAMPTLVVFSDGEEIGRMVGARGRDQLLADIDEIIA